MITIETFREANKMEVPCRLCKRIMDFMGAEPIDRDDPLRGRMLSMAGVYLCGKCGHEMLLSLPEFEAISDEDNPNQRRYLKALHNIQ